MRLQEKNHAELEAFQAECQQAYKQFQAENLKLDMSRGKPAPAQLELSMGMMDCLKKGDYRAENGLDCRNYDHILFVIPLCGHNGARRNGESYC